MKFSKFALVFVVSLLCINHLHSQISFTEDAVNMGVNHIYPVGQSGGGISFADFNNDGLDDLTFGTSAGDLIHFYRNTGNGFIRNAPLINNSSEHKQILWADYDNDGDLDLFVCAKGDVNRLYQNNGDLKLEDITESSGLLTDSLDTFNACWADFNRDGWLDLYVCERVPLNSNLNSNRLYLNNADGTFSEVSMPHGASSPGKPPFSSSSLDYNNDKWPDIYIANDRERGNVLLHNDGDAFFSDYGAITNTDAAMDGMSVAIADVNQDGYSDFYVSNTSSGNRLFINKSEGGFEECANKSGVSFGGTAWGANFLDAENDGDMDLYVSGAIVGKNAISSAFFENTSSDSITFSKVLSGFEGDTIASYANAVGDINNDGYPDIGVVNKSVKSFLFVNGSSGNNWIKIKLEGVKSNRDGIGSKLEIYAGDLYQSHYTHSGIGFLGQNSASVIFGLRNRNVVDSLKITWPTGHIDIFSEIEVNETIKVLEGSSNSGEILIDNDISIQESNFTSIVLEEDNSPEVLVYPNPFTDEFTVISEHSPVLSIRMFDVYGNQSNQSQSKESGIYFLTIHLENGMVVVKKIVRI